MTLPKRSVAVAKVPSRPVVLAFPGRWSRWQQGSSAPASHGDEPVEVLEASGEALHDAAVGNGGARMDCPLAMMSTTTMAAPQCLQTNFGGQATTGVTSGGSAAPIASGDGGCRS